MKLELGNPDHGKPRKQGFKWNPLLILIIILIALHFATLVMSEADLIFDEASHISIARSLIEGKGYGYVGTPGSDAFRPPLVPAVYAALFAVFGATYLVARVMSVIFLALAIVVIYFLGKNVFNKNAGFYAAIFTAAAPTLWFYSTKAMVETALIFFAAVFLYAFYRSQDKDKWLLLAIPSLALLLLTKYTAGIFALFFVIWLLWKKRDWLKSRHFWIGIALAILILSPWFANNIAIYGNPVGAITTQLFNAGQQTPAFYYDFTEARETLPLTDPFYITTGLPLLVSLFAPFTLLGLYYLYRDKQRKHLAIFLLLIMLFLLLLSVLSEKRDRYLLPLIPVIALITGYGFERLGKKKIAAIALAIIVILSVAGTLYFMNNYPKHERFEALKEAGIYLQANCMEKEVYSNVYPYVFWFTGKPSPELSEASGEPGACVLVDNYMINDPDTYQTIQDSYSLLFSSGQVEVYTG